MNGKKLSKHYVVFSALFVLTFGCQQISEETKSMSNLVKEECTVTFYPNAPADCPEAEWLTEITQTYTAGSEVYAPDDLFSLEGYRLIRWADKPSSYYDSYSYYDVGEYFYIHENMNLYAIWEIVAPQKALIIEDGVVTGFKSESGITEVVIPDGVTAIGSNAFRNCSGLTSITIPSSVTEIGSSAFDDCSSLTSITVNYDNLNYSSQDGILYDKDKTEIIYVPKAISGEVTIPDGVTTIGSNTFGNCSNLTSVTIPDSITKIESSAFSGCAQLAIHYKGTREQWEKLETEIFVQVVCADDGLGSENQPDVLTIERRAVTKCDTSATGFIEIQPGVTKIAAKAFSNCDKIKGVIIPDGVTRIENGAFKYCSEMVSIQIPGSVKYIGDEAFGYCNKLTEVNFTGTLGQLSELGLDAKGLADINKVAVTCNYKNYQSKGLCHFVDSGDETLTGYVIIPSGITEIHREAFKDCKDIKGVGIPSSVKSIGRNAFYNCSSLTSITIPDSVTEIGYSAFDGCWSLTSVYYNGNVENWCKITFYSNPLYYAENFYINGKLVTEFIIPDGVTTIGSHVFKHCRSLTNITIPDSVTSIESGAFQGCHSLVSVYYNGSIEDWCNIKFMGGEITYTGNYEYISNPLYYAGNLYINGELVTELVIPDGVTTIGCRAFMNCDSLTSVTIPDSVTSIGFDAFRWCGNLTSITMGNGVTEIGSDAFQSCNSLTEVYYNGNIEDWCKITFNKGECSNPMCHAKNLYINGELVTAELVIPDSVTEIKDYAFYNCSSLTSVTIPDSVTKIGKDAFYNCSSLISITIPDSVTEIGDSSSYDSTFSGCNKITTAIMPTWAISKIVKYCKDSLQTVVITGGTTIDDYAFDRFNSLTSVTIPDSITKIGKDAFINCNNLKDVYYNGNIEDWCKITFTPNIGISGTAYSNPLYYAENFYINGELVTELIIPYRVTEIKDYAFKGGKNLTSVTIPDSVTKIGQYTFSGFITTAKIPTWAISKVVECCKYRLQTVVITSGTSIGSYAFNGCSGLMNITIPDSVTSIGSNAFYNCSSLTSINFEGTKAQWDALNKVNSWDENTGNYTIYCTDGEISK